MSPAPHSKAKDKNASRADASASVGIPSSGYDPILGTLNTFEGVPSGSPLHMNGRFRNTDDMDDNNGNSLGAGIEIDSISNNGSWSGESEDHKEKISQPSRQEPIPGAGNDKREKTRLKNEKKHQRQREKRAQELHERCSGYLMSRKLEALAQQLVAMGFTIERATMALILNEGRLEESVAWLFEGGEESNHAEHSIDSGGNLKIDISEELEKITGLEIRYKVSKQEVERAIVACEGNIEKAEEVLKASKQENIAAPAIAEAKLTADVGQISMSGRLNIMASASMQQKRDGKDFNYTRVEGLMGPSVDNSSKGTLEVRKAPYKVDWSKPQPKTVPMDKRWSNLTLIPSVSNALQAAPPPFKIESHHLALGDDLKNLQLESREPVVVMQRHQSINGNLASSSTAGSPPTGAAMGWHSSGIDMAKPNGSLSPIAISRSLGNGVNPHSLYSQLHFPPQKHLSNISSTDPQESSRPNISWSRGGASSTLAEASSLGLFSGLGASCSSGSSTFDWKAGSSMPQFDYANIDWSLDTRSLASRSSGSWPGMNYSSQKNSHPGESFRYSLGLKPTMRPDLTTGNGMVVPLSPEAGVASSLQPIPNGPRDQWASTFDDNDPFGFSRQFVSSPSL